MRYTKYNYTKKSKNKVVAILPFIIIISLGIIFGAIVFKIIFISNNSIANIFNGLNVTETVSNEDEYKLSLGIIQCGLFKKKENATSEILKIPSNFSRFIIEEDEKYKVMAGLYISEDLEEKKSELDKNSIENFIMKYEINKETKDGKIEGEIINGYLKIINKIFNDEVKSINTQEFKIWAKSLSDVDTSKSEVIQVLLERINLLPEEYEREKGEEDIIFLYNLIKTYRK